VVSIINKSIINDLSNKADWRLGSILVEVGHVEVIHEVDENFAKRWSKDHTGSLVDLRFNNNLHGF